VYPREDREDIGMVTPSSKKKRACRAGEKGGGTIFISVGGEKKGEGLAENRKTNGVLQSQWGLGGGEVIRNRNLAG